jgi:hypothetical protein
LLLNLKCKKIIIRNSYPLFWVDEHFTIDQKNADKFYYQVKMPLMMLNYGQWVVYGLAIACMVINIGYGLIVWKRSKSTQIYDDEENLIINNSSDETKANTTEENNNNNNDLNDNHNSDDTTSKDENESLEKENSEENIIEIH